MKYFHFTSSENCRKVEARSYRVKSSLVPGCLNKLVEEVADCVFAIGTSLKPTTSPVWAPVMISRVVEGADMSICIRDFFKSIVLPVLYTISSKFQLHKESS